MKVRNHVIKLFIWFEIVLLSAVVGAGILYGLALLVKDQFLISLAESPATYLSASFFALILLLWFFGLAFRTTVAIVFRKRTVALDVRERLAKLSVEALHRMHLNVKVRFLVLKRSSNAFTRRSRILVGEKLLQESTDDEVMGFVGHEIGHVVGRHERVKLLWTLVPALAGAVVLGLFLGRTNSRIESWFVPIMTMMAAIALLGIPFNWRLEYYADKFAAVHLGTATIVNALSRFKTLHFDGVSFTHPPLSKRIRRLQENRKDEV